MKKIMMLVVVMLLVLSVSYVNAIRISGSGYSGAPQTTPPPTVAIMPTVKPAKFDSEIIDDFVKKSKSHYSDIKVIKQVGNVSEFKLKGNLTGILVIYDHEKEMSKEHKKVLELNKLGYMYSWSYGKRRILVVLPPELGEEEARRFDDIMDTLEE